MKTTSDSIKTSGLLSPVRLAVLGLGLLSNCVYTPPPNPNIQLRIVDAETTDTPQEMDGGVDSSIQVDTTTDTSPVIDAEVSDSGDESAVDAVVTMDGGTLVDAVSTTDTPTTDEGSDASSSDSGMRDATAEAASDAGTTAMDVPDARDGGIATDSGTDAGTDASSDRPAEIGVDAATGPVISPTGAGLGSCDLVIVEGIAGCLPGAMTCTYHRATDTFLRYYIRLVTTPTAGPAPTSYSFQHMLREPPVLSVTIPDTGRFTTAYTTGSYTVRATVITATYVSAPCYGPTLTIAP